MLSLAAWQLRVLRRHCLWLWKGGMAIERQARIIPGDIGVYQDLSASNQISGKPVIGQLAGGIADPTG